MLRCAALYGESLNYTALRSIAIYCAASRYTALHMHIATAALRYIAARGRTALHGAALRCNFLLSDILGCNARHCTHGDALNCAAHTAMH
jgi:hypothetical protein